MSVEEKLAQLESLAESLKEQEALALEEAKEKKTETEDEPEGSDSKSEIETDEDEDSEEDEKKDEAPAKAKNESKETKMDLGALFEGTEFTEEFRATATEIFEAAVEARVKEEVASIEAELQESFEQQALTESTELKESLVDKVDGYLDYMVEQWMNKNELAINRGIKTEILESFVSGMKDVFESHYIDVPDEKFDLVEAAQTEVADLETRLDEAVARNVELTGTLKEISRQIMIDEAVEGLVETDAEKFRQLAEELTYSDEGFDKKLAMIKESYFSKSAKPEVKQIVEEFMTDEPVTEMIEESAKIDPVMAQYLTAIERSTF